MHDTHVSFIWVKEAQNKLSMKKKNWQSWLNSVGTINDIP